MMKSRGTLHPVAAKFIAIEDCVKPLIAALRIFLSFNKAASVFTCGCLAYSLSMSCKFLIRN